MKKYSTPIEENVRRGQSVGPAGDGSTVVPPDEQGISNRPGDEDVDEDDDEDEDELDEDVDEDEVTDPEAEPGKPT